MSAPISLLLPSTGDTEHNEKQSISVLAKTYHSGRNSLVVEGLNELRILISDLSKLAYMSTV
jgi:hypothetical protein